MDHGRLAFEGAVSEMVTAGEHLSLTAAPVDKALAVLGDRASAGTGGVITVQAARSEAPALIRSLVEAGVDITEARWSGVDLEAFFFARTKGISR